MLVTDLEARLGGSGDMRLSMSKDLLGRAGGSEAVGTTVVTGLTSC